MNNNTKLTLLFVAIFLISVITSLVVWGVTIGAVIAFVVIFALFGLPLIIIVMSFQGYGKEYKRDKGTRGLPEDKRVVEAPRITERLG